MPNMNYTSNFSIAKIAKIKILLNKKEMTSKELAEAIHTSTRNMNGYIRYLKLNNLIYIFKYDKVKHKTKAQNTAFYKFGSLPDVKKPLPKTALEKSREKRAKLLSDPELHDFFNAKRRAKRIKPKADWSSSWIFR